MGRRRVRMTNKPSYRFAGYNDIWKEMRFGEVVKRSSKSIENPDLPIVEYEDVISGEGRLNKNIFQKLSNKKGLYFSEGDVLFGKLRPYLQNWLLPKFTGLAVGDWWVLQSSELDSKFLYTYIQTRKYQAVSNLSTGTKMPRSDWNTVSDSFLHFPTLLEQKTIGTFFQELDQLISLQQRKLEVLKEQKKTYLKLLFPAKGQKKPALRFAGFEDEWKEVKLGEILVERNEQISESEEYQLMSFVQGKGVVPKSDRYDRSFLVKDDKKNYKKTEYGDFIYSSNNLDTGSIGFNKTGKALISPVYSIFYSKTKKESQFIAILSQRKEFINEMIKYRQGVVYGQFRIHERDFLNIRILAPESHEQEALITFFQDIDRVIAKQEEKVNHLKESKQTLLRKMFI